MKYSWLPVILFLFFSACGKKQEETVCFHAVKADYTEKIKLKGSIRAENSIFVKSPAMFLSTIIWLEENGKFVQEGDTVCLLEHPETREQLESFLEELKKMKAQLDKVEADQQVQLAVLQAEIENNNIRLSINSLDSIQKRFAPPLQQKLISLEHKKATILNEKLKRKYTSQKLITETEIRSLESRIKQMENRIQRIQDELKQLIITAPAEGFLVRLEVPVIQFMSGTGSGSVGGKITEGSSTFPNMNILEIPDMSKMQILAELSESNYKKAVEGQKAIITVDAKNKLITSGKIKRKMLSGKNGRDSKVKYYEAIIEIDSCHKQLTPGLNAECDVIIHDLKDTLVIPAIAVFEENEEKFVYVSEGKKFRKTAVETGIINTTWCVITSGIPSGSFIALSKPSAGSIIIEKDVMIRKDSSFIDTLEKSISGYNSIQINQPTKQSSHEYFIKNPDMAYR